MLIKVKEGGFMKRKQIDPIPDFKNYKEEALFWDTHSLADYWDEWEEGPEIVFDLEKPRDETLIVRLQKGIKDNLEKIAKNKGINVSTLTRMWILEKMRTEISS